MFFQLKNCEDSKPQRQLSDQDAFPWTQLSHVRLRGGWPNPHDLGSVALQSTKCLSPAVGACVGATHHAP